MDQEEKKYRRISMIITAVIQVILMALVYVLIAWREPDPPIPEYGIELSFGFEETGAGEPVQQPVQEVREIEESQAQEEVVEDQNEDQPPVKDVEETSLETEEEVYEDPKSPDVVEKEEEKSQPVEEKSLETSITNTSSTKEENQKKKEVVNSQGDKDESGVQGDPEAKIDERALYGEKDGSQDGASLELTGWSWDFRPNPKDDSEETGKVVFEIKIDDQGYIVSIKTLISTVTPRVENIYRRSVEQLTFSKTSEYQPAPFSTGKITFIIRSK